MALPTTLNPARPSGTDAVNDPASTLDNQLRDLKQLIADIFGIPVDPTSLTAAAWSQTAAGVVTNLLGLHIGTAAPATPVAGRIYSDSIVRGWVETSGAGAPVIDADVNVSSITDNGVGDWTINWATSFTTANYAVVATAINGAGLATGAYVTEDTATAKTAALVRINIFSRGTPSTATNPVLADPDVGISLIAIGAQ